MKNINIKENFVNLKINDLIGKNIHFCGIGGIGMSAIAGFMAEYGITVQGSDIRNSKITAQLERKGVKIFIGHSEENVNNADVVVYSTAVKLKDNPETAKAINDGKIMLHRSEALNIIANNYKKIIVSGAHGKTTTSSIIGYIMDKCGKDPAVITGGIMNHYESNYKFGNGENIVCEADESDGSCGNIVSDSVILTNIDREHVDFYNEQNTMEGLFYGMCVNSSNAILCIDDQKLFEISKQLPKNKVITYGFHEDADYRIVIDGSEKSQHFLFKIHHKDKIYNIKTSLYGKHNAQNITAAFALSAIYIENKDDIIEAISTFSGVMRRFSQVGCINNALVIDDYAHHPTEIKALIKCAEDFTSLNDKYKNIVFVCQPHRYSRFLYLLDEFYNCFASKLIKKLFICDVYSAGEVRPDGFRIEDHLANIKEKSFLDDVEILDIENISEKINEKSVSGEDLLVFCGAGSISMKIREYVDSLK